MKLRLTPVTLGLCLLGLYTLPAFADNSSANNANEAQLINNLTQKTAALQQQIEALQTQLAALKANEQTTIHHKNKAKTCRAQVATQTSAVTGSGVCYVRQNQSSNQNNTVPVQAHVVAPQSYSPPSLQAPANEVAMTRPVGGVPSTTTPLSLLSNAALIFGGMPIVTSPYLGVRSAFDASDLISNFPNINEDLHLLTERQKIEDVFDKYCEPLPGVPFVDLSGQMQATVFAQRAAAGRNQSNIDLPTAELYAMGGINRWTTVFLALAYDNTPPNELTPPQEGPVTSNSRLYLDQGFITIGNLNRFPVYGTIGQEYVAFGQYNSYMVSNPLTMNMARIKARALGLGFDEPYTYYGLDAQVFTFKGDSTTVPNASQINNIGANADYTWNKGNWNAAIGGSYIANIADSLGMQETGATTGFAGFGSDVPASNTELLVHRVPAYDLHGNFGYAPFSIQGEYITASTNFSPENMTFNGQGALPEASDIEAAYTFKIFNRPSNFALGYEQTRDALALLLPQHRYSAVFNTSIWRDTVESLEYRHDVNYSASSTATGQDETVTTSSLGLGHSSDTVTAQLSAYF